MVFDQYSYWFSIDMNYIEKSLLLLRHFGLEKTAPFLVQSLSQKSAPQLNQ